MAVIIGQGEALDPAAAQAVAQALGAEAEPRGGYYRFRTQGPAPARQVLEALRERYAIDLNALPEGFDGGAARLVVSDMDSTLITIECVDELADYAGRKAEVSRVTEAAMQGEIDFETSLRERVRVLAGLEEGALQAVYDERLHLSSGAENLVAGLKRRGLAFALVSGGFTFFTDRLAERLGLDFTRANTLELQDGRLTGEVLGEVVDGDVKATFLQDCCRVLDIGPERAIAMGDGANDLPMMRLAGLGVAYRAKPRTQAEADAVIDHNGLDALLPLLDG